MKKFDKISKFIGIKNRGLRRLFIYLYLFGYTILFSLIIIGLNEYFVFDDFIPLRNTLIGLLLYTPSYLLILCILVPTFFNPILWIIKGFYEEE